MFFKIDKFEFLKLTNRHLVKKNILLSIITGLMLALAFPPMPFPLIAFVAFVPLLSVFHFREYKYSYLLIYIAFWMYHAGANWWIGSWQKETDPYLLASGVGLTFIHPFFFMIPFLIYFYIRKKFGKNLALWLFPFAWTSFEWLHGLGEASYPWLTIGNTQIYSYRWIQFIDITGVWGASFLLALSSVLVVKGIDIYFQNGRNFNTTFKNKLFKRMAILMILIIILPVIYSEIQITRYDFKKLIEKNKKITISLIQPDIDPWDKWDSNVFGQITEHLRLSDSIAKATVKPDVTIWSETAVAYGSLSLNSQFEFPFLHRWVDTTGINLLTGFAELHFFKNKSEATPTARHFVNDTNFLYEAYNAAIMVNPGWESKPQLYRKMRLTPLAERLPYAEYLLFMRKWFEWSVGISAWGKGKEQKNLNIFKGKDTVPIGTIICIESVYPGFVRNFTKLGAEILCVITNDAWYNYTVGPDQHFEIAAVRAVENKRCIARCANSGVTGFISPTGQRIYTAPQYEKTAIAMSLPLLTDKTFYVEHGDWFPAGISFFVLVVIIIGFSKKNFY